jgi:hypothetical protein
VIVCKEIKSKKRLEQRYASADQEIIAHKRQWQKEDFNILPYLRKLKLKLIFTASLGKNTLRGTRFLSTRHPREQ